MGLRKGQKELVEQYRGGMCAVPAIPGGGKTHSLAVWTAEMIARGLHRPGKILIVTYMNSAVSNFRQRISQELQKRGINSGKDYCVSTIHSLCLEIIRERPDLALAAEEFDVADDHGKMALMASAVDEWAGRNPSKLVEYLDEPYLQPARARDIMPFWKETFCRIMLSIIGDFKSRGISPSEMAAKCSHLDDLSLLKWASEIYGIYDRKLKMTGCLDFDDMLHNAKKLLLEDRELLEKYRRRYSFVCEDEAQDSNLIQSDILKLIAHGNFLRVGDSNQAICGSFTNSDFRLFREFCRQPDTVVYNITQSSRSTRQIIELANCFVRYIREEHPVESCRESLLPQFIEPVGPGDERPNPQIDEYGIRAGIFNSWEEEAAAVVKNASAMLERHPDKSLAILVPTYRLMGAVLEGLEALGVPFRELSSSAGSDAALKKLGVVLDYLSAPYNGQKLATMIKVCFEEEMAAHKPVKGAIGRTKGDYGIGLLEQYLRKAAVEDLLYPTDGNHDSLPDEVADTAACKVLLDKLPFVKDFLEQPITRISSLILHIAEKLNFDAEEMAIAQKVASDAGMLVNREMSFSLGGLAAELLAGKSMFTHYAAVIRDLEGYEPKPGEVAVLTYHKAKGLEWDIVFLTALSNGDFPVTLEDKFMGEYWFLRQEYKNPLAIARAELRRLMEGEAQKGEAQEGEAQESEVQESEVQEGEAQEGLPGDPLLEARLETISERARLLYVGITRARQYLYLSGFHANQGKKNESPPSRYLLELRKFIEEERMKWHGNQAQ